MTPLLGNITSADPTLSTTCYAQVQEGAGRTRKDTDTEWRGSDQQSGRVGVNLRCVREEVSSCQEESIPTESTKEVQVDSYIYLNGQMKNVIRTPCISLLEVDSNSNQNQAPILLCSSFISELGECGLMVLAEDNKEDGHRSMYC
jgi:hypothetical protein